MVVDEGGRCYEHSSKKLGVKFIFLVWYDIIMYYTLLCAHLGLARLQPIPVFVCPWAPKTSSPCTGSAMMWSTEKHTKIWRPLRHDLAREQELHILEFYWKKIELYKQAKIPKHCLSTCHFYSIPVSAFYSMSLPIEKKNTTNFPSFHSRELLLAYARWALS